MKLTFKIDSKAIAIALGIIAIVLLAGLVVAIASYTAIISGKDNSIKTITNQKNQLQISLNGNTTLLGQTQKWLNGNKTLLSQTQTWLDDNITYYNSQINSSARAIIYLQNEVNTLNATVITLSGQVIALTNIVNLSNSTTWVNDTTVGEPAGAYTVWVNSTRYAGYVSVFVQSSNVSDTHVMVTYSAYGASFDLIQVVSVGDTAIFPVLPCSSITVGVGNGTLTNGARVPSTQTVTITYYY
jgi:hypothetical protein